MNRKLMLFGAVYSIFGMSAIVFSVPSFAINNVFAFRTRTNNTHIVLDKTNQPNISSGSGSLTYNEYATISYVGASIKEDCHVSLADDGTLYKNEASNSLSSFLVSFSGNLILHTGYNGVDDTCYEYTLESGVSTEVRGNYFKLISIGATDIESIDISFGCITEDGETHTPSSIWSHDETKHWHVCEDPNCVRKLDEANHVVRNLAQVDPTNEETGLTAGTDCSVCGRILSGRDVLPVLDQEGTNYEYRRRTTKVGDVVADFDEYIWLDDTSVVIHNNPGEPLDEYVHAGSSYYSIPTWNNLFPNQEAVVSGETGNRTLTMTLDGDTTVTAEDRVSDLDGTFDLTLYKNVVIDGTGTLSITYTEDQDGIKCHNLSIGENVTLNLTGNSATSMTGVSFAGTLQIDGTYNVNKFGNGIGINIDINASATDHILVNGELSVTNCKDGIHAWNTPSGGATIDVNGELNMNNISEQGMELVSAVTVNFNTGCNASITAGINAILRNSSGIINFKDGVVNLTATGSSSDSTAIGSLTNVALQTNNAAAINFDGGVVNITSGDIGIKTSAKMAFTFKDNANVNITADKVGIYASSNSNDDDNLTKMTGNASLTIISQNGSGIYCNNGGCFKIEGSSTLDITANSGGIYGFRMLRVYEGSWKTPTKVNASLIVKSAGASGSNGGKTPDGNPIQGRGNNSTDIGFSTNGEVLIEKTGTQSKTGLHLGGNASNKGGNFTIVDCGNFTIKNCSNAIGCWVASGATVTYTHSSDQYKIYVVDCVKIVNGTTLSGLSAYTSSTVNFITTNV